ncbi:general secretion pathway protein GspB [Mangrovitalea sediminis]|uniref:general secretion pathway protein GspB n=1 Tax=Mangrovitalea sediminis TaxID=1982043 RepID=UPI000BE57479|nr:general secretion pathway protein GspB [Mangrovitalea sediminis]
MSYILDALRKSESERRQGRIPDLGTTVQMVHKKRSQGLHWSFWIAVALVVNAGVFAYLFWPRPTPSAKPVVASSVPKSAVAEPASKAATAAVPAVAATPSPQTAQATPSGAKPLPAGALVTPPSPSKTQVVSAQSGVPTLIVPSEGDQSSLPSASAATPAPGPTTTIAKTSSTPDLAHPDSIPLLVDEPLSFQQQVPPLHFSGHIYSSVPSARRVVINDMYLGEGDSLGDLKVERITESGVVFDLNGQLFRVGVVSDWNGPN